MIEDRDWLAMTAKQEAEGEGETGMLMVCCSIVNRMRIKNKNTSQIVLASYQYSCWNTSSPTRMRVQPDLDQAVWRAAYRAADLALGGHVDDPTKGATHYLNPKAVLATGKPLPKWFTAATQLAAHGKHIFVKTSF